MTISRADKGLLVDWVLEAVGELGGKADLVDVAKRIWKKHEGELRKSGDLFFTWQYDMRWAAQELRLRGKLKAARGKRRMPWELS